MWVGLTGFMGSGKSKVASLFGQYEDVVLHNADELAKKAISIPDGLQFLQETFGEEFVDNGQVNFSKLAELVFSDKEQLSKLEAYSHPIVEKWLKSNYKKNKINIVENALLFEMGWDKWCDKVISVNCHPNARKERLLAKGLTEEQIKQRMKNQVSISTANKYKRSDFVIDNSLGEDVLERAVLVVLLQLRG